MSELVFHPLFSLFPLIILFFISMAAAAEANNTTHPNCPSYSCNDINISYPFYKLGTESSIQFCGYQGFGINCTIAGRLERPIIHIGNDSYFVRNIFYENTSIVLVDYDVSPAVTGPVPNSCPRVQHSIDIDTLPLTFSTFTSNLSFHFNCSGFPPFATEIPCLHYVGGNKSSCVNIVNSDNEKFDWDSYSCEDQVVTTVFHDQINAHDLALPRDYGNALSIGFELGWGRGDHEDCDKCEESDGRCGYHNTNDFLCYCADNSTSKNHCKGMIFILLLFQL